MGTKGSQHGQRTQSEYRRHEEVGRLVVAGGH